MATGDIKNNIRRLLAILRKMKYPDDVSAEMLAAGSPDTLQEIYHYAFVDFSPNIAEEIHEKLGFELGAKTDMRFTNGLYRIFRDIYNYKPSVTKEQFTSLGFAERKIIMAFEVLEMIMKRHSNLSSKQSKVSLGADSQCRLVSKSSKGLRGSCEMDKADRHCATNVLKSKIPKLNTVRPPSPSSQKPNQEPAQISPYTVMAEVNNNKCVEENAYLTARRASDFHDLAVMNCNVVNSVNEYEAENPLCNSKETLANGISASVVKNTLSCGSGLNENMKSEEELDPKHSIDDQASVGSSNFCFSPELAPFISGPRTSSPAAKSKSNHSQKSDGSEFRQTFWEYQEKVDKNFELILIKLTEMDARLSALENVLFQRRSALS